MILDIPTKADFDNNGIAFLNLAWETVLSIALNLPKQPSEESKDDEDAEEKKTGSDAVPEAAEEAGEEVSNEGDPRSEEDERRWAEAVKHHPELPKTVERRALEDRRWAQAVAEYWRVAQQELATAVALAQQGTEFLLKGKIAQVSPFLLISGDPGEWPSGCDRVDISFADFKTIDAQDLIRAHDTLCAPRLSDQFKERFEQLRRLRNSVMHTVDRRLRFTTQDGVLAILEMVEAMIGPNAWLGLRRQHLQREPDFDPDYDEDHRRCRMAREVVYVVDLLQRGQVRRFFNFDKRQRRYLCPGCEYECANWQIGVTLAQLEPNAPDSTNVFCFLCGENYEVRRETCGLGGCPGNVISSEYDECLTCGGRRPEGGVLRHPGEGGPIPSPASSEPTADEATLEGGNGAIGES